jgi:hypothetical protein
MRSHFPTDVTLLLYTDGLIEGRDPNGTFFPLEERLSGQRRSRSGKRSMSVRLPLWRSANAADLLPRQFGELTECRLARFLKL